MKKLIISIAAALAAATTIHADIPSYNLRCPGSENGRGFYVGVQGGVNLYQTTASDSGDGDKFSSKSNVGGFGGLKFGYIMGTSLDTIRPAFEYEGFYNGFSQSLNGDLLGNKFDNGKLTVNSGAFLINGILRFALGSFQPYFGAGAGIYTADESVKIDDFNIDVDGVKTRVGVDTSVHSTGFAWQVVVGADYFIVQDVSVFTEYKFLNYMDSGSRLGQQLVGAGVRFHF